MLDGFVFLWARYPCRRTGLPGPVLRVIKEKRSTACDRSPFETFQPPFRYVKGGVVAMVKLCTGQDKQFPICCHGQAMYRPRQQFLTLTVTNTHSLYQSLSRTLGLSMMLRLCLAFHLSLARSLALCHTHGHTHTHALSATHKHTFSLWHPHAHTLTHLRAVHDVEVVLSLPPLSCSHSRSVSHTQTHTHTRSLCHT